VVGGSSVVPLGSYHVSHGIPFGYGAFRIGAFAAWPFGREIVSADMIGQERRGGTTLANLLWVVIAGLWLALFQAVWGVVLCFTVIGIPWGLQYFKLAQISFAPLGKRVVPKDVAKLAREEAARERLGL
jgi:uncharacterized membrane protein YccF (DUF307 family)